MAGTGGWFFFVKKKGACVSTFTRSATPLHLTPPFLGHLYPARLALLGWGREEEKKAVVKLLWAARRYFRSATRKIPGF